MADFGGDGIRLRGIAGKRLEEQQKKFRRLSKRT